MARALRSGLIIAISLACAAYWAAHAPARYRASAVIDLSTPASPRDDSVARRLESDEWLETQLYLITSRNVSERAARLLETRAPVVRLSAEQLQSNTTAERLPDTSLLRAVYVDGDPARAALVANAIAEAFLYRSFEERLLDVQRSRSILEEKMRALTDQIHASDSELAVQVQRSPNALPVEECLELVTKQVSSLRAASATCASRARQYRGSGRRRVGVGRIVAPAIAPAQPLPAPHARHATLGHGAGMLLVAHPEVAAAMFSMKSGRAT